MSLEITLHTPPTVPLEAEVLTPERLRANGAAGALEHLPVLHGNESARLGDFFGVRGSPADGDIVLGGDLSRVKLVGAGMGSGRLVVDGSVGAHLGAGMSGGEIHVRGDAGDWVAPEMSGGRIVIDGRAGHMVGSAYRGSAVGMTGGEIVVRGAVGNETGAGMRRGLIAVGGDAGDFAGVNMLAGTVAVLGRLGARAGAGMRRGTLFTLQGAELLPTFSYDCRYRPAFLRLYLLHLMALGMAITDDHLGGAFDRWSGDGIELNRGEILIYAA